jgi:zinc protease
LYSEAATYNASVAVQHALETTNGEVHEEMLDNGLRVLIQEVRTAPLASVWCWYRVGSKNEGRG